MPLPSRLLSVRRGHVFLGSTSRSHSSFRNSEILPSSHWSISPRSRPLINALTLPFTIANPSCSGSGHLQSVGKTRIHFCCYSSKIWPPSYRNCVLKMVSLLKFPFVRLWWYRLTNCQITNISHSPKADANASVLLYLSAQSSELSWPCIELLNFSDLKALVNSMLSLIFGVDYIFGLPLD